MFRNILPVLVILIVSSCVDSNKTQNEVNASFKRDSISLGDYSFYKGIDTLKTVEVEKHLIHISNKKVKDTLIIENLADLEGEPQLFSIITIKGHESLIQLKNVAGYKIDFNTNIEFENLLSSDLVYLFENRELDKFLIIWDFQYPDCTNLVEIIKLSNHEATKVFSESILIKEIKSGEEGSLVLTVEDSCTQLTSEVRIQ